MIDNCPAIYFDFSGRSETPTSTAKTKKVFQGIIQQPHEFHSHQREERREKTKKKNANLIIIGIHGFAAVQQYPPPLPSHPSGLPRERGRGRQFRPATTYDEEKFPTEE